MATAVHAEAVASYCKTYISFCFSLHLYLTCYFFSAHRIIIEVLMKHIVPMTKMYFYALEKEARFEVENKESITLSFWLL